MSHDELERLIDASREYNQPPEPPREEMWAVIRDGLPIGDPLDLDSRRAVRRRRRQLRRWTPWAVGLAAAATLAVGFGLGRLTREPGPAPASETAATEAGPSLPVRLAAADHLGEAEAMLTMYRAADRSDDRMATATWARDLLSTTRMLIDSRVGEDPELAQLLSDLELVLVQIASTSAGDEREQEMIEDGMEQLQLMAKLRAAAAPVTGAI
jgi:hypothetical protein